MQLIRAFFLLLLLQHTDKKGWLRTLALRAELAFQFRFGIILRWKQFKFTAWNTFHFQGVSGKLANQALTCQIHIEHLTLRWNYGLLFKRKQPITVLNASAVKLTVAPETLSVAMQKEPHGVSTRDPCLLLLTLVNRLQSVLVRSLPRMPHRVTVDKIQATIPSRFGEIRLRSTELTLRETVFKTLVEVEQDGVSNGRDFSNSCSVHITGVVDVSNKSFEAEAVLVPPCRITAVDGQDRKMIIGLEHATANVIFRHHELDKSTLSMKLKGEKLRLLLPFLSSADSRIPNVEALLEFAIAGEAIYLKSGSHLALGQLVLSATGNLSAKTKVLAGRLWSNSVSLEDFLRSSIQNWKKYHSLSTSGRMSIHVAYKMDVTNPVNHYFDAKLMRENFHILQLGEADLNYLKDSFVHRVVEEGQIIREINLDPSNPHFRQLHQMPHYLANAIVVTEDPFFFRHNGIDLRFFGRAIAMNYNHRKFALGGSTITMQLIRNLCLHHKKDISRKLEEMMLALIVENACQVPKKRILELYLNVIEMAPSFYGMSESAHYYFEKSVSELTVAESLLLTYIIPRPKYFLEALKTKSPRLLENVPQHVARFSNVMLKRGLITPEQHRGMEEEIKFASSLNVASIKLSAVADGS